jgi:predicted phage tail protein
MANEPFGSATLRRIEWLTLMMGGLGAAWAAWRWGWRGALGLVLGALLSWLNFRWLKGSVQAFGAAALAQVESQAQSQTGSPAGQPAVVRTAPVPRSAYLKFFGRFALLLGAVYVILTRTWFPAISVLAGLFASAAGVIVGLAWELLSSGVRDSVRRGS